MKFNKEEKIIIIVIVSIFILTIVTFGILIYSRYNGTTVKEFEVTGKVVDYTSYPIKVYDNTWTMNYVSFIDTGNDNFRVAVSNKYKDYKKIKNLGIGHSVDVKLFVREKDNNIVEILFECLD